MAGRVLLILTILVASLTGGRASAEVLVTTDGQQIQTKGPYELKGRRILYTDVANQLVSIRTSLVDLEATEAANKPPEPPPKPDYAKIWNEYAAAREDAKKRAVVITQSEVSSASGSALAAMGGNPLALSQLSESEKTEVVTPLVYFGLELVVAYRRDGAFDEENVGRWVPRLRSLVTTYNYRARMEDRPKVAAAYAAVASQVETISRNCDNADTCADILSAFAREFDL